MALEAVVVSQQGSRFGCGAMAGVPWSGLFGGVEGMLEMGGVSSGSWDWDAAARSPPPPPLLHGFQEELGDAPAAGALPAASGGSASGAGLEAVTTATTAGRRKRRRARAVKNKEEVESQRMIHIAVERNRRKQMNEYLAVLRSLMPPAYVQRVITLHHTDELASCASSS
ncbi:hypothetical protein U9M48_014660 [Paspalum notatum var. saurae]|uniref:BHLH domain-containing protein n=1 Tax=Paspalum notatum var. saurae TaxID=547442 RepID=A0AAQ3T204_PASNO